MSSLKQQARSPVRVEQAEGVLVARSPRTAPARRGNCAAAACMNSSSSASYRRLAQPALRQADVERVVEQLLVLGADVERDRQARLRVDAGAGRVERQLADRDAHAIRAEVAQAEDALAVGDHDHADVARAASCAGSARSRPRSRALMNRPRGAPPDVRRTRWQARPTVGV